MKTKIELKDINGNVLFVHECEDNNIKKTVEEAVWQRISLYTADLRNADLHDADLRNADLHYADLHDADLRWANLYGANLYFANLSGVILRNTNLSYANLSEAKLCGANLTNTRLYRANLSYANLKGTDLTSANLTTANLSESYLYRANLWETKLNGANLSKANLCTANLYRADLRGANLSNVKLYGTNLYNTNLIEAKNIPFIPMACPSEGAFIGWKMVCGCLLIKLFVPEDAKRSSGTTNKCRCDKAKVLEIVNLDTNEKLNNIVNCNFAACLYTVGEMVYPDSFDDNRWNECSNGIHFFINKEEAINYR